MESSKVTEQQKGSQSSNPPPSPLERAYALREHIYAQPPDAFRNKPKALTAAIEEYARANDVPMIFSQAKMAVSRKVLESLSPAPRVVLEFGTYIGSSAIGWADILADLHSGATEGLKVWTFEFDPERAALAREFVELAGLSDVVVVLDGEAAGSVRKLVDEAKVKKGEVDVVFMDHWKNYYLPDLRLCEELGLFKDGSVVIADNTDYPGAPDYVEYVQKGGSGGDGAVRYKSESLDSGEDYGGSGYPRIVEVSKVHMGS